MRLSMALAVGFLSAAATVVSAQTPPPAPAAVLDHGYIEGIAQSAFGNVTSQSSGAEIGITLRKELQVFGSFGKIRDVATPEIGASAQTIAGALTLLQTGAVSYSVKEPATFVVGGVRYRIPSASVLKPYLLGGAGMATVTKNVTFFIAGANAASTLAQYVTVGTDLSGDETKLIFVVGGGIVWPAWRQLIVDLQYQYGHISTDTPITVNRAGIGVGVRF